MSGEILRSLPLVGTRFYLPPAMADDLTAQSPEWFRDRLLRRWEREVPVRRDLIAIYDGTHPYPVPMRKYRDAYLRLLEVSRSPWARMIVDTYVDRLRLIGFSTNGEINDVLWQSIRSSYIETLQIPIHREALIVGTSYASVDLYGPERDATVAYESCLEVVHETAPGDPYNVIAALKLWHDSVSGVHRCILSLPEANYRWIAPGTTNEDIALSTQLTPVQRSWSPDPDGSAVANPLGKVAVVPFVVRRDADGYGRSDLSSFVPMLNRIELSVANLLLAMELGAFRQRWATGLEVPTDEDGNYVEPYKIALDRLWVSEDPETNFGSFPETDLRPIEQAIDQAIAQLSAVSRVPSYYFQTSWANPPSAQMLEIAESGLVTAVKERQNSLGESWEAVVALMGASPDTVAWWADPRVRSEAQLHDAAIKLSQLVPMPQVWQFLGYTPTDIKRMEREQMTQQFDRLLTTPLPQATGLQAAGTPGGNGTGVPGA